MSSAFDAYRDWLNILPDEQPPNYYRLLGLNACEGDAETISQAAEMQAALVRPHLKGPRAALAQKLLKQIEAVRDYLLNAEKKSAYDAKLRHKQSSAGSAPNHQSAAAESRQPGAQSVGVAPEQTLAGAQKVKYLGEYLIMSKIGSGGMGQVYKAQHQRMKRIVALKVLPPQAVISPNSVRRFNREVQAAARLSHPNIVTAYDAGEQQGIHYLVMEYVSGSDLSTLVREHGPMDFDSALDCILQVARGLEYAHNEGVIHRDIKPSNLLVDHRGTVKILDMGLARFEEGSSDYDHPDNPGLTRTEQIMGTVDYMSPEQAEDTRKADARSDIYSLGCTLYSLLTGAAPFAADTVMKRLLAHRSAEIPSLVAQRPNTPKPLDAAFRRMVAKNPADRFQSMTDVITALEACRQAVAAAEQKGGGDDKSYWNLFSWGAARDGSRSSILRSRSYEPTVELSNPDEETVPRSHEIFAQVKRNPLVAVAGATALVLLIVAAIWVTVAARERAATVDQSVAVAPKTNVDQKATGDAKSLDQTASVEQNKTPPDGNSSSEPKSDAPAAEVSTVPPTPSAKNNPGLDVLALVDLEKNPPRRGNWTHDAGGLQYAPEVGVVGRLALPVTVTGSYRWRIEISGRGAGIGQLLIFPVGSSWARLMFDGTNTQMPHFAGLDNVKGLPATDPENPTATIFKIEPGKRYKLELTVHVARSNAEVRFAVDGQEIFKWSGPASDLALPNARQGNSPVMPALLGVRGFTIYSLQIEPLEGGSVKPRALAADAKSKKSTD